MRNKILILYPYFTPAYKAGGPIQSIGSMVKSLGYELNFSIFCSNKDHDGTEINVQPDTWLPYNQSKVFYASADFLNAGNIIKLIKERKPSALFINGIYSLKFNILPLLKTKGIRKIVSVRGMLHPGALSQKSFKKKVYLGVWKLLGLHKKCEFHATTYEEKTFIENVFGKGIKTWVAGNFPNTLQCQLPPKKKNNGLILISIALVSPMKNHLLVLQSLQNVTANVEYHIYGPIKDIAYWKQCEVVIKKMPLNIKVSYEGETIPTKISEALSSAHVFILPSKSENFGHAIYEALSAGKPVITSNNTPWNNLQQFQAGINADPENTKELSDAITYFASMNQEEFMHWSKGANKYAAEAINIEEIKEQYKRMFAA